MIAVPREVISISPVAPYYRGRSRSSCPGSGCRWGCSRSRSGIEGAASVRTSSPTRSMTSGPARRMPRPRRRVRAPGARRGRQAGLGRRRQTRCRRRFRRSSREPDIGPEPVVTQRKASPQAATRLSRSTEWRDFILALGTRAADSDAMKNRRRTTTKTKRPSAPKVSGRRKPIRHQRRHKIALLKRERDEALEQQKATAEVLRIISASPGDLEPVFDAMLANAVRLCEAKFGFLWLAESDGFRPVALHNVPHALAFARRHDQVIHFGPETPIGRLARNQAAGACRGHHLRIRDT